MFSLTDRRIDTGLDRKSKDRDSDPVDAAGDIDLIDRFKSDHASLLTMLHEIEDTLIRGQFAAIPPRLDAFREHLQAHLAEENEKFYTPLHTQPARDAAIMAMVKEAEARMIGIARMVLVFAKRYVESGITSGNREQFARDLEIIEALLTDRIQTEETSLYPLCAPD